jgi:phosphomannomutase
MNKKIQFGTGGFRGIIGDDFNKENIQLIAQALANVIEANNQHDRPIIIGFDNRFMSDYAAKWFAEVLNGNGIKTYVYTHSVPTPTVMSTTRDMRNYYGVMITASHNPYYFNGIKVFTKEGYDADVAFTSLLEKKIGEVKEVKVLQERLARKKDLYEDYDNLGSYLSHIKSFIDPTVTQNKLRVLYNNMNGVGVIGLKPLAEKLHIYQFTIMNEDHDAFFGFNLPNPTKEALEGEFSETVFNQGYDLGMATDSDGDRLGIIDERGNYVSANEILASIYWYLITQRGYKGDVVKNCATSVLVDMVAESLGYKCHEVDVGFKNITAGMKEFDALLGGESSGGLTMRGYIYGKDATFSGALFLEMAIKLKKPVSRIIYEMKRRVGYDYYCSEDFITLDVDAQKVIAYMRDNLLNLSIKYKDVKIFNRNIKFLFDDRQWLLLRLSGTEPAFRVFAEFKYQEDSDALVKELKDYIEEVQNKVAEEASK